MFGFDERYAMFDITPVENHFILEYLPDAKGDYVKVYLYGLMRCYHPEDDMSPERMARELNMTEDDVAAAFRYWERRGLVRRISDKPPRWRYVNIKQRDLSGEEARDPEYEAFSDAVYAAFDKVRRLHGSELSKCFEWREDLKLPTEVIVMLLNHMAEVKGRNFKIADADRIAVRMADEDIRTVDAAEEFFIRDGQTYQAVKEILKKLGKRNLPSEAQVNMYLKWIREWHFTPEAIEEALELTAKGEPSMGYLDGILKRLWQDNGGADGELGKERVIRSTRRSDALREVLNELGRGDVTPQNLKLYDRMKALYPQEVILTAARECGHSGKGTEDVLLLLNSWKAKGLENREQIDAYVQAFHRQTDLVHELRSIWGMNVSRVTKTDRDFLTRWEKEMGFSREMILDTASLASNARIPMIYLDSILKTYRDKGITTPEEAAKEREQFQNAGKAKPAKTVIAQQYDQRDYSHVQEELIAQQDREMEEYLLRENGGEPDA